MKKKQKRRRTRPTTAQEQKDRIVSACSFHTIDFDTRAMIVNGPGLFRTPNGSGDVAASTWRYATADET